MWTCVSPSLFILVCLYIIDLVASVSIHYLSTSCQQSSGLWYTPFQGNTASTLRFSSNPPALIKFPHPFTMTVRSVASHHCHNCPRLLTGLALLIHRTIRYLTSCLHLMIGSPPAFLAFRVVSFISFPSHRNQNQIKKNYFILCIASSTPTSTYMSSYIPPLPIHPSIYPACPLAQLPLTSGVYACPTYVVDKKNFVISSSNKLLFLAYQRHNSPSTLSGSSANRSKRTSYRIRSVRLRYFSSFARLCTSFPRPCLLALS